jgi:DNA invertase Pin-like site-specific DNA recombinase
MTTHGCHYVGMTTENNAAAQQATFDRIREVRAEAIKHTQLARKFAAERRDLMQGLIREGVSQAEIARELGVTRQAIQKMLAC